MTVPKLNPAVEVNYYMWIRPSNKSPQGTRVLDTILFPDAWLAAGNPY